MTRHILSQYRNAAPEHLATGTEWYDTAFTITEHLAWRYGRPITHSVVALAHLSPRITWRKNVEHLEILLSGAPRPLHVMSRSWDAAKAALEIEDPLSTFSRRALKTHSFAQAILGDRNAVVIDIWAARAAGVPEDSIRSIHRYHAVADAYRRGARRIGIAARELQAVVWCAARGTHE